LFIFNFDVDMAGDNFSLQNPNFDVDMAGDHCNCCWRCFLPDNLWVSKVNTPMGMSYTVGNFNWGLCNSYHVYSCANVVDDGVIFMCKCNCCWSCFLHDNLWVIKVNTPMGMSYTVVVDAGVICGMWNSADNRCL
jgi:hypothetical protein